MRLIEGNYLRIPNLITREIFQVITKLFIFIITYIYIRKSKEEIGTLKLHRQQQNRILQQQRKHEIEKKKTEEHMIANQVRFIDYKIYFGKILSIAFHGLITKQNFLQNVSDKSFFAKYARKS